MPAQYRGPDRLRRAQNVEHGETGEAAFRVIPREAASDSL